MSTHDPANDLVTVEAVAKAIEDNTCCSIDESVENITEAAVAVLDALAALGWRGPLTEEQKHDLREVLDDAMRRAAKSGQDMAMTIRLNRLRELRAMLGEGA